MMDSQSRISAPAQTAVTTAAKEIAKAALTATTRRKILIALPVAAAVIALITIVAIRPRKGGEASAVAFRSTPNAQSLLSSTATSKPLRTINVGVYLSHFTATGPSWVRTPYGYFAQTRTLGDLRAPDLALKPVVEPQTESLGQLPAQLKTNFPRRR